MLLVHVCCADCALKLVESLETEYSLSQAETALYFLNPNIHPESEYLARLKAVQKVFKEKSYKLIVPNYRPKDYFAVMKPFYGAGDIFSKQYRCPNCWQFRLGQSFEYAKNNGFDEVSSTLLSSIYQDSDKIIKIAQSLAKKLGLKLLVPGNINHCLYTSGFYKQNYCGCVFSLKERMEEKYFSSTGSPD